MKALKRKVRKYKKKWLKYKLHSLWVAFKKVRNSYFGLLNIKKKTAIYRTRSMSVPKDS